MITQAIANSYKTEILSGVHLASHDYYIALFTSSAALSKATTTYTGLADEVSNSGTNYTTGGKILAGFSTVLINDTATLDFTDIAWTSATFTARGALIYNNTLAGKNAVCVLDFSTDYSCVNGTFTITFPAVGESTALIRIV